MSTTRTNHWLWNGKAGRGPGARPRCRTCWTYHQLETDVPRGRRIHCGASCAEEYLRRNNPTYARALVFRRDRGVCARCGLDTEAFRRAAQAWSWAATEQERARRRGETPALEEVAVRLWRYFSRERYARRRWRTVFASYGFPADGHWASSWWEADHIVPVCEGGGQCDLDGLRTLCCYCHRLATRALAARRLVRGRAARGQPALFGQEAAR